MKLGTAVIFLALAPVWAQDIQFPAGLDKLAAKASETVDVTLDGAMLKLAGRFLSNEDPEEAKVKKLVAGLKGIYVRAYEFDSDNAYSRSDIDAVRAQLKPPTWSRMVGVISRSGDNAEVFAKLDGDKMTGLVVIASEPRELAIVNIVGPIDLDELSELGGHFGVPKVERKKAAPKD